MTLVVAAILVVGALLALMAIWALAWAVSTGQMRSFAHGATSIFDDEEPIGTFTDGFPGDQSRFDAAANSMRGESAD